MARIQLGESLADNLFHRTGYARAVRLPAFALVMAHR